MRGVPRGQVRGARPILTIASSYLLCNKMQIAPCNTSFAIYLQYKNGNQKCPRYETCLLGKNNRRRARTQLFLCGSQPVPPTSNTRIESIFSLENLKRRKCNHKSENITHARAQKQTIAQNSKLAECLREFCHHYNGNSGYDGEGSPLKMTLIQPRNSQLTGPYNNTVDCRQRTTRMMTEMIMQQGFVFIFMATILIVFVSVVVIPPPLRASIKWAKCC